MARTCGLLFIVLDVLKPLQHKKIIEKELEGFGIRLVFHGVGVVIVILVVINVDSMPRLLIYTSRRRIREE